MKQFKILFAYLLCICLSVSCSDSDETIVYSTPLRTVITGMDYGDGVLVVGHKSPDCDAVLSAMTYASLLQRMGINAEARVAGKRYLRATLCVARGRHRSTCHPGRCGRAEHHHDRPQ